MSFIARPFTYSLPPSFLPPSLTPSLTPSHPTKLVPEPFALTQPRVRKFQVPEPVQPQRKAKPVPASHYKAIPITNMKQERQHLVQLERMEQIYRETNRHQFTIVDRTAKSMKVRKDRAQLAQAPIADTQTVKANPVPRNLFNATKASAVRLTAATILREESLVRKKQEEERKRIEQDLTVAAAGTISKRELELRQEEIKTLGMYSIRK